MEHPVNTATSTPNVATEISWIDRFVDDFYQRYTRHVWIGAGVIIALIAGYLIWNSYSKDQAIKANKDLGAAYTFLGKDQVPQAEKALTEFVSKGQNGLSRDKGNLFLGKLYYDQGKFDQSLEVYGKVKGHRKAPLLLAGALHGQAACYMQKKEYDKAIKTMDEFLAKYMVRTGSPKENLVGEEVVDLSPVVPDVLFKQALCHSELKQPTKVKELVEKLSKVYPNSKEALNGQKLLALIE